MSKSLIAAALVATMVLAVLGKEFTILNYPGANCTGTPNASTLPLDTCLPIPPGYGNFTASKFGMPREITVATIYPDASAGCAVLGQAVYVPCGRCMDSERAGVGYYRYLCDVKNQSVHSERGCDAKCTKCAEVGTVKVGECVKYDNGTKTFVLGALGRAQAISEILYDGANQTCTNLDHPRAYDVPCGRCLGYSFFNCTLLGSGGALSGPKLLPTEARLHRLPGAALGNSARHGRMN